MNAGGQIGEQAMAAALNAIHEEASGLLGRTDIPSDAKEVIELIMSISTVQVRRAR